MPDKLNKYDCVRVVEVQGRTDKEGNDGTYSFWRIKAETMRVQLNGDQSDVGQTFEYSTYDEPVFRDVEHDGIYWINFYLGGKPEDDLRRRMIRHQENRPPKVMQARHSWEEIMNGDDRALPAYVEPLARRVEPPVAVEQGFDEEDKRPPPSTSKPVVSNYQQKEASTRQSIEKQTSLKAATDIACAFINAKSVLFKPLIQKYVNATDDSYERQVDTIRAINNSIRPDTTWILSIAKDAYGFIAKSEEEANDAS
jgi:hypothetical protein